MKAELQNKLTEKYREFFEWLNEDQRIITHDENPWEAVKELHEQKSIVVPIQFGFECGDGWYMLLDELMAKIENHIWNVNRNRKYELRSKFAKWLNRKRYRISYKRKVLKKFLEWIVDQFPRGIEPMDSINITQIKEKFGGLCFYYNGGDDYIFGLTRFAESLSYQICEECGSTIGVGMTQGWNLTICKKCYNKAPERIKNRKWMPVKEAPLLKN